ncbi:hypothetical protein SteCoe_3246 [Stentor coeruleus]|uniref:Uncharacterized protein n=1 Tax=Stentor coeruleus TaxID=5963 RepID=A0A1R2CXI4_9CILI|nr:hypothetical protein SteCoe_3246 [Stentor coeruleus]
MSKNNILSEPTHLTQKEISDYFVFLKIADCKLKEIYTYFPEIFNSFAKASNFNKLKMILSEKQIHNGIYDKTTIRLKQDYVKSILKSLKNMIEAPRKRFCPNEKLMNWHDAFDVLIKATSSITVENKIGVKKTLKELCM